MDWRKAVKKIVRCGTNAYQPLKHSEGFSVISLIFGMLLLSAIGMNMSPLVSTKAMSELAYLKGQEAFYVAEGGLDYILAKEFMNDGDSDFSTNVSPTGAPFGGTPIALGQGQFWVVYLNLTKDSGDVLVTARVGNSVRQVQQTINRASLAASALQSGGNTDLSESQSGGGLIEGDISYGGNFSSDPGYSILGNIAGGAQPPAVDLTTLINLTTSTYTGNLTIDGNYSNNTHVTGDVDIEDEGTITGIIVADGDVTIDVKQSGFRNVTGTIAAAGNISGNFKQQSVATFQPQAAGGAMQPMFYAGGNIELDFHQQTTVTFRGLIHAGGNIDLKLRQQDSVSVEGALMANGNIEVDSKQQSFLTIDKEAGGVFLDGGYNVEKWQEK